MKLRRSLRKLGNRPLLAWSKRDRVEGIVVKTRRNFQRRDHKRHSSGIFLRKIMGESMSPTLRHGQIVVCWKSQFASPGDIVIVAHNGIEKIKRLQTVRTHHIYILGDNATQSTDSRHYGWVERSAIVGRVIWPLSDKVSNRT